MFLLATSSHLDAQGCSALTELATHFWTIAVTTSSVTDSTAQRYSYLKLKVSANALSCEVEVSYFVVFNSANIFSHCSAAIGKREILQMRMRMLLLPLLPNVYLCRNSGFHHDKQYVTLWWRLSKRDCGGQNWKNPRRRPVTGSIPFYHYHIVLPLRFARSHLGVSILTVKGLV